MKSEGREVPPDIWEFSACFLLPSSPSPSSTFSTTSTYYFFALPHFHLYIPFTFSTYFVPPPHHPLLASFISTLSTFITTSTLTSNNFTYTSIFKAVFKLQAIPRRHLYTV
ncbi:hypothetical protein Pmani_021847 [Petrolisthes manimaculis]|uniref:Uncharacterized protein n=1 Tax=Petrolisthes manimaculis TaxID=1843537 RepID=A0AAE1U198_9EUCA|nr:hypothetical protein Pmani_021847 [Petrolisthes manimaculis]